MRLMLHVHVLTVAIAASYLTLLVASPDDAQSVLIEYAVVMLMLALANLLTERRKSDG